MISRAGQGQIALFIAVLAGFITPFDLSAVSIALPSLAQEFSMDAVRMGWVSTAYLLASAVFLVPFGRIADISGRKKVFTAGLPGNAPGISRGDEKFPDHLFCHVHCRYLPLACPVQRGRGGWRLPPVKHFRHCI